MIFESRRFCLTTVKMPQILDAVLSCDLSQVTLLLTNLTEINNPITDSGRLTLLHVASGIQNLEIQAIVSYLLKCGANPNASADEGLTPVHISTMWNNLLTLGQLLTFGGNPLLQDYENKNAFDLAVETNAHECLNLLKAFKLKQDGNIEDLPITHENTYAYDELHNEYDSFIQNIMQGDQYTISIRSHTSISNFSHNDAFIKDEDRHSVRNQLTTFGNCQCDVKKLSPLCPKTLDNSGAKIERCKFLEGFFFSDSDSSSDTFQSLTSLKSLIIDKVLEKKLPNTCSRGKNDILYNSASNESASLDASVCSTVASRNSTVIEITHTDAEEDIVFIEQRYLATPNECLVSDNSQSYYSDCSFESDWKSYQTAYQTLSSLDSSTSFDTPVKLSPGLLCLKNSEIFEKLKQLGDNPGPVLSTTRYVYLLRLTKLSAGTIPRCSLPRMKFSEEIYSFLDGKLDITKVQELEQKISMEFDQLALTDQLPDGNQRRSFIYFLLDPRVTKNLPYRSTILSSKEKFMIFMDSLFYVGKGTRGRPFCHLYEAAKVFNTSSRQLNSKVMHILDIWQSGLGVISLHCFQNCISIEAFTREACIIEAIGLSNLTNIKRGQFYGTAAKLTASKKKQLGVLFLSRALEIFLLEGERLIRLKDVT